MIDLPSFGSFFVDATLLVIAAIGWKRSWDLEREANAQASTWEATAVRSGRRGSMVAELMVTLAIGCVALYILSMGRWRDGISLESHWIDMAVLIIAVLACLAVWAWTTPSHRRPLMALGIAIGGLALGLGIGAVFILYGLLGLTGSCVLAFVVVAYLLHRKETAQ